MIARIINRLGVKVKENAKTLLVAAVLTAAAGCVALRAGELQPRSCADTMMLALAGPDAEVTRQAFDCAGPRVRLSMGGSAEAAIKSNAEFPSGRVERIGAADQYVFYVLRYDSGRTDFYVLTLDAEGKVVSIA